MSIFETKDIDSILIEFLSVDDLRNLYQVNRYYRDKIFVILEPFIRFYQKSDTIKLLDWIKTDKHFNKAIVYGNLQVCKYVMKKYKCGNINNSFGLSCIKDHLEIAKWLYSLGNLYIHADNEFAFRYSCGDGHLEMAKWLHSLGVNHNAENDYAFRWSCFNGHLEIAQWLYSLGVNNNVNNDYAFQLSCGKGHLKVAHWLYSLGVNHNADNDLVFQLSCQNGHLEVAKWLYSLGVNHNAKNDYAFRWSCENDHLEVAKWLCTADPRYKIEVIDGKIKYIIN